jgi:hypothetical protein
MVPRPPGSRSRYIPRHRLSFDIPFRKPLKFNCIEVHHDFPQSVSPRAAHRRWTVAPSGSGREIHGSSKILRLSPDHGAYGHSCPLNFGHPADACSVEALVHALSPIAKLPLSAPHRTRTQSLHYRSTGEPVTPVGRFRLPGNPSSEKGESACLVPASIAAHWRGSL